MDELNIIGTLNELTTVFLIVAAVFFIAAVALFFALDIPRVIGDLTGRTAKKEIANIRAQNLSGGPKAYRPSTVNRQRGKITEKIGSNSSQKSVRLAGIQTEKIGKYSPRDEKTELLDEQTDNNETILLDNSGGENFKANETTVLNADVSQDQDFNQTTILSSEKTLTMLQEILFVHTNEFIT